MKDPETKYRHEHNIIKDYERLELTKKLIRGEKK